MDRFAYLFALLSIFYLLSQSKPAHSSSGGYGGGSSGASKLNLGVWIPPMTLRLPKFNMPKIKISATIKPRKNQPPMKIHLPEMSLNAKALGDDDNYGGGSHSYGGGKSSGYSDGAGGYGGSGSGYSSGDYRNSGSSYNGDNYSSGSPDYGGSGGYSNSAPSSYGGADSGYSSGMSNSYNDYSSGSNGGYRASAATNQQMTNDPYKSQVSQPNYNNQRLNNNYNGMDYENGNRQQQDQRNVYYTVDNQSQPPTRHQQPESVSYGASNNVQAGSYPLGKPQYGDRTTYRSSISASSGVQPLTNYLTNKQENSGSVYGYTVKPNYGMNRYARH